MHPRCATCRKPLSWRQRSDAVYCSPACRVAAYRLRTIAPKIRSMRRLTTQAPSWLGSDDDLCVVGWSADVECDVCGTTGPATISSIGSVTGRVRQNFCLGCCDV